MQASYVTSMSDRKPAASAWFLSALVVSVVAFIVYKVVKYPSEGNRPMRDTLLKKTPDTKK
jgi:hypothetical protein